MAKITFQNLPSTSTPLNANNLNEIQTNIPRYKTFDLSYGQSVNLTFDGSTVICLFSAQAGLGGATELWLIGTYGQGGTSRTSVDQIHQGNSSARQLTYSISDQTITITNPMTQSTSKCSLTFLVGSIDNVTITAVS